MHWKENKYGLQLLEQMKKQHKGKNKVPDPKTQKTTQETKSPNFPNDPAVCSFITNTLQKLETMDPISPPEPNLTMKEKTLPPMK